MIRATLMSEISCQYSQVYDYPRNTKWPLNLQ